MKLTVNSQDLAARLRLLNKVVPAKPPVAILSHALLRVDTVLDLHASDTELSLSTTCAVEVEETGECVVPLTKFLALVERFPDADVQLAADSKQITIRCGAFKSQLQTADARDFIHLPVAEGDVATLSAQALRQLIEKTRHSVITTGSRYVLKGALLTLKDQVAAMVATDGKRLAAATAARGGNGSDQSIVIPAKTLDLLKEQLGTEEVEVSSGPRHLFFKIGEHLIASRTIDGTFPNYQRIIPKDNTKQIVADRSALAAALRRVTLISEENQAVYFNVSPGTIELSAASVGVGMADEAINISYDGEPIRICINGEYVLDFLDTAFGSSVTIMLKDARGSALLIDENKDIGVIMLMRA